MQHQSLNTMALLGRPLNEVEAKYEPAKLFISGDIRLAQMSPRVSLIGSRKATESALQKTKLFAKELVKRGIVIVSGLAEGIDTAAHSGAIEAGGKTIAVLGTPLDVFYPAQNKILQKEIMKNHLCISQFPIGTPVNRKSFPIRNRTMALISNATVIMQASENSGSLHQGWEALRLNRPLYIFKSAIIDSEQKWVNDFLNYGAEILDDNSLNELVEVLPHSDSLLYENAFVPA